MIFCTAKRRLLSTAQIMIDAHIIQQVQPPQEIEWTKIELIELQNSRNTLKMSMPIEFL